MLPFRGKESTLYSLHAWPSCFVQLLCFVKGCRIALWHIFFRNDILLGATSLMFLYSRSFSMFRDGLLALFGFNQLEEKKPHFLVLLT